MTFNKVTSAKLAKLPVESLLLINLGDGKSIILKKRQVSEKKASWVNGRTTFTSKQIERADSKILYVPNQMEIEFDYDLAKTLLEYDIAYYATLPEEFKLNKEFAALRLKDNLQYKFNRQDEKAINDLPESLKTDKEFMQKMIIKFCKFADLYRLDSLGYGYLDDRNFVIRMMDGGYMDCCGYPEKFVKICIPRYCNDREIMLMGVKLCGKALVFHSLPDKLKLDEEIISEAIKNIRESEYEEYPLANEIPESMITKKSIQLVALEYGLILNNLIPEILEDKTLLISLINEHNRFNIMRFPQISEKYATDYDVAKMHILKNPSTFKYFNKDITTSKKLYEELSNEKELILYKVIGSMELYQRTDIEILSAMKPHLSDVELTKLGYQIPTILYNELFKIDNSPKENSLTLKKLKDDASTGKMILTATKARHDKFLGADRRVVEVNTVCIGIQNEDGQISRLEIPNASLVEYTGDTLSIFESGYRDLNKKEKEVMDEWKTIATSKESVERYHVDAISEGNSMYYQQKAFFISKGYEYLFSGGSSLKVDSNTGLICDSNIRGTKSLEYKVTFED